MPTSSGPTASTAGWPPWPVAASATAGGIAVASGAATLVDWLLGGGIEDVFVVIGAVAAIAAVAAGGYSLHALGASLGPTMHAIVVGAVAVGFVHLGAFVIVPLLLAWLFDCPQLPSCNGGCGCEGCDPDIDPCPPCPPGGSETSGPCGGSGNDAGGGGGGCGCIVWPGAGSLASIAAASRPGTWRNALAHHPDDPAFADDVFHVGGLRLCIGCTLTYPTFLLAALGLTLADPGLPWWSLLGLGGLLTSLQGLSAAGWTSTKPRKVAVKLALGLGTAGLLAGVRASPWPAPGQALVLLGLLGLVLASAIPRSRRMAAWREGTSGER